MGFANIYNAFKRSALHEPHLRPLVGMIAMAPILTVASILWTSTKADVKIIRYGDTSQWRHLDPTAVSQTLFAFKSHRKAYVRDPEVEELRKEIYDYDTFRNRK